MIYEAERNGMCPFWTQTSSEYPIYLCKSSIKHARLLVCSHKRCTGGLSSAAGSCTLLLLAMDSDVMQLLDGSSFSSVPLSEF